MEEVTADAIRMHFEQITIPVGPYQLADHARILDLPDYISTQIGRLESSSRLVRTCAYRHLADIASKLGHALPEG